MAIARKIYVGDAVYAEYEGSELVLTTSDGITDTNTIYLEPEVLQRLLDFVRAVAAYDHRQGVSKAAAPGNL